MSRSRLALLSLALLLAAPLKALAQDDGEAPPPPPSDDGGGNGGGDQSGDGGQKGDGGDREQPDSGGAMSLDDAKVNMFTLLQSFLTARQVDGVWPLKSKLGGGGLLHLVLVDDEIRKIRALGGKKYRGLVGFTDERARKDYDAEFTVDLSGAEWKVLGMNLKPVPRRKAKKKKKPVVETPAEDPDESRPSDAPGAP